MNVAILRFVILKNGSRQGNFSEPHNAVCSRICATPVSSFGVVWKATLEIKQKKKPLIENKNFFWF